MNGPNAYFITKTAQSELNCPIYQILVVGKPQTTLNLDFRMFGFQTIFYLAQLDRFLFFKNNGKCQKTLSTLSTFQFGYFINLFKNRSLRSFKPVWSISFLFLATFLGQNFFFKFLAAAIALFILKKVKTFYFYFYFYFFKFFLNKFQSFYNIPLKWRYIISQT